MPHRAIQNVATGFATLTLRRLQWATIAVPLAFFGSYSYLMLGPLRSSLHAWYGVVLLWILLPLAVAVFSRIVFGAVRFMQAENITLLEEAKQTNERLVALYEMNLALSRETELDVVLQRVVDLSARLTGAQTAGLALIDDQGRVTDVIAAEGSTPLRADYAASITASGVVEAWLSHPERTQTIDDLRRLNSTPTGEGLLAATAFLGVPLSYRGSVVGGLLLAEKEGGSPFGELDEEIVRMFASHAAVVIENMSIHEGMTALAIEQERQRISHELHDGLAQVLSFVNTKAQAVEQYISSGDPESAAAQLAELSQAARDVYVDVREGIVALQMQGGGDRSLRSVLDEYLEEFRSFSKLRVEARWNIQADRLALPSIVEVQLLRIVQEALTNVRRHAHASSVSVSFDGVDGELAVTVRDDGLGFDPMNLARGQWPRFGLRTMRERAESTGGMLSVDSVRGTGTVVTARFPNVVAR